MAENQGFTLPKPISFEEERETQDKEPIRSAFSNTEALESAQMIQLSDGEGSILFYPKRVQLEVGDILFLRERDETPGLSTEQTSLPVSENGVVVQIISLGTASYPQADTKALFRLMVNVRASTMNRSHNEPKEIIDEFLVAEFKVRAEIRDNEWKSPEGQVVTRNVDIFWLDPSTLSRHIFDTSTGLNVNLGEYKEEAVAFFGGGFEKINLITGMKGGGKSHIAKGIISESLKAGMSAIVFDINNEYQQLPNSHYYYPGLNLRFRLDRIQSSTFLDLVQRIAPFAERTSLIARSDLPRIISARASEKNHVPDLDFLIAQDSNIIPGNNNNEAIRNMRTSYRLSLGAIKKFGLIMSEEEALTEDEFLKGNITEPPDVLSLASVLHNIVETSKPEVIIFGIGGLLSFIQFTIVDLIVDTLKEISKKQDKKYKEELEKGNVYVPIYPTIFFEEAHMYMEPKVIDDLLPLIRHFGMNVFFITNTPGALPDSVFRLMDNLIMTKMLNKRDIDQVKNCGLTDVETIEGFARNLKTHHALLLSGKNGATNNFPLVFHVRDFELGSSGETKSMWEVMKKKAESSKAKDTSK